MVCQSGHGEVLGGGRGRGLLLQLLADYLGTTVVLEDFWQARQNNTTGQYNYTVAV